MTSTTTSSQDIPAQSPQSTGGVSQLSAITWVICVASAVLVFWNLQTGSLKNANTGSRYATVESLVDHGTYYIDKSRYKHTIDKVKVGKHYLSSKPPTLPTYGAGAYWLYQKVTGKTIAKHEGAVVPFVSLCTGGLAHLVFLLYFFRLLRLHIKRETAILTTMAAAGFAWLGVGYATTMNNHSVGAALAVVGLYYTHRIGRGESVRARHWVIAGLVLGFLPAIDLPSATLSGLSGLYLLSKDWKRTLYLFAPALLPGFCCQLYLGYTTTHSLVPAYLNRDLKDFQGNYFREARTGIDALYEPKPTYAFHILLGHHGLFSMTPLLAFGAYEMARRLGRRATRSLELLVLVSTIVIITGFYIYRTHNYGGWCVGMRWLVPIMPFFLLYFGIWMDRVRLTRLTFAAVLVAFSVSSFHVHDALGSPFQFSRWHNWLEDKPNRNRHADKLNLPKKSKKKRTKKRPKRKRTPAPSP